MASIDFAIVHHANQYLITNGYQNREGLDDVLGMPGARTGYSRIFELHQKYSIPFNLHLSGTLLEAIVWHRPDFLRHLEDLRREGLVDFIGSSYGQNIMRFFDYRHNLRQLAEGLMLYGDHLGTEPHTIKAFWPPERIWDTGSLAAVLTDKGLSNGGYEYVLVDDRLFYPKGKGTPSRKDFDEGRAHDFTDFYPCRIVGGHGLTALPISSLLRTNIPPSDLGSLEKVRDLCVWLAEMNSRAECGLIAIYGDDLEKSSGCCGWDEGGPEQYETFLQWLAANPWIRPVKLNSWTSTHCVAYSQPIKLGSYFEMSRLFGAGEGYEKWFLDPRWNKYRNHYAWSEAKVTDVAARGADPALLEMAWKNLLSSTWETAWHTPAYGVHGNASSAEGPSPWIKAVASHSRHAAVSAEAAYWLKHKDSKTHALLYDIDNDGQQELILRNDHVFAVFSPSCGGRLVYLFNISEAEGKLVIGNPCDDWNWLQELNRYMNIPANHPGALADTGYEDDMYEAVISAAEGEKASAVLVNRQAGSRALGLEKFLELAQGANEVQVTYRLPPDLSDLSIECGFSPDYLHLLRHGPGSLKEYTASNALGYANNGVSGWVRLQDPTKTVYDEAGPREFGHGHAIRIRARESTFTVWLGSERQVEP